LVPLVVASSSSARHPVVVAVARRVSPRRQQQQAGTGTGASACDAHPDDDDDDDDDAVLTAAVPVIVDGEAASAYAIPPTATAAGGGGIRYHEVLPTDTFQGLCLRYGVTPTELRRANKMLMTGSDLKLAPEVLVVPSNGKNNARLLDDDGRRRPPTKGEMIATLVHRVSRATKDRLTHSEALAYLDMADGDVDGAVANAREDFGWSAEEGKWGGGGGIGGGGRRIPKLAPTWRWPIGTWTPPSAASARTSARLRGLRTGLHNIYYGGEKFDRWNSCSCMLCSNGFDV